MSEPGAIRREQWGPRSRRLGVFGGTFDPVHIGHLVVALDVRHALALDTVLLVVANQPWQKLAARVVTPAGERLAMLEAAVAGVAGLEASAVEIERGGPSYMADTVEQLAGRHPDAALFLVVGSDVVAELATWRRVDALRSGVTLVIVNRPGTPAARPEGWRVARVPVPALGISSTDLRARAAAGQPLTFLTPDAVVSHIYSRGLYGATTKPAGPSPLAPDCADADGPGMDSAALAATPPGPLVLTAAAVEALPAVALDESITGVTHRVVWRDGASMVGVLTVAAGHRLGTHAHRRHHHHIWVVDGDAEILGATVGAGSYVHVPAGVDHDLDARATRGCTVFYLYLLPGA